MGSVRQPRTLIHGVSVLAMEKVLRWLRILFYRSSTCVGIKVILGRRCGCLDLIDAFSPADNLDLDMRRSSMNGSHAVSCLQVFRTQDVNVRFLLM